MSGHDVEALDPNFKQRKVGETQGVIWRSATDSLFNVRGLAWFEENGRSYCRLPHRAESSVSPAVWSLAQSPSSARMAFRTDSSRLFLRQENFHPANMPHFAATGSDGVFVYEGEPFRQHPWGMAVPALHETIVEKAIAESLPRRMREFAVYLPLYAPLRRLEIGLDSDARIEAPRPFELHKPVVFYGTSITQGGCASTAGGDFVSALGRRLHLDVVNLGFSGNGKGEPELARLIAEIDAAAYVLDYCANTDAQGLEVTLPAFIDTLRGRRPETPIVCVGKIHLAQEAFNPKERAAAEAQRDVMIRCYSACRAAGDANIHFIDGWSLVGAYEDLALVDGVHPTSHGFSLMAERMVSPLRHVLGI